MEPSTLLDPVDALACHFRSFGAELSANKTPLRIPSSLKSQLSEKLGTPGLEGTLTAPYHSKTTANLVSSISDQDFERWCLLDATAFIFVTRILLEAEPCLAKDQGFFRLIEALETLRDQSSELSMPERLLSIYKNTVGESLAAKLLDTFIDCEESGFSRRWAGMLLVELLEESEGNKDRVWKMPDMFFKDIGEIIISGDDRILKIVAGKIIWQLTQPIEDEEEIRQRLPTFCQSDLDGDFTKGFPLQSGSQWESGFANFINDMELNRYDLDLGPPNGYTAVQVMLGKNSPISSDIGAITINIAEIFSIYIPPNADRSPDWVDLKIVNISKIEFTKQILTENSMDDLMYLKLHLHDYDQDGYLYLLSMRPSSDSDSITILCYKNEVEDFAGDIEKCRGKVLLRKGRQQISSAPLRDIQANPEYRKSQQEKINELERHREDILKVLESPTAKSDDYASSLTDPDEFEDGWDMCLSEYKPVGPRDGESDTKERGKENSRIDPMTAGVSEEDTIISPAKKPLAPKLLTQGRCTPASSLKNPTKTSDIIPESSLAAPITPDFDPKHIRKVISERFSAPLRPSSSVHGLQKVKKLNLPPINSSQSSRTANSNCKKGLEDASEILKGKTPSILGDNTKHHPDTSADEQTEAKLSMKTSTLKKPAEPQKKHEGIYKPKPGSSAKLLKLPSEALMVHGESTKLRAEYFDTPAVDNSHGKSKDNPPSLISEKQLSRNPPAKENSLPIVEKNSKEIVKSAVFGITDDRKKLRAPPHTYGTKNKKKGASKPKGKTPNKDDPPNKNNLQVMATKSVKSRIPPVKLDKERLLPSDDTSIWELPVSEEPEIEPRNEKKKGTIHPKMLSPKKPAPKSRQPIKSKPPPKKRVYGKSVVKPEPKSKEIISNSDKELEVESPPARKQKQSPRSKNKDIPKIVPDKTNFEQDSEDESEDQVAAHSLRPKVKPRPKPKSRSSPASGLTNRTLPKHNEDEQMKSSEIESIRASTPPTPTPKTRKKELVKLTPAKRTAFEDSDNDGHARPSSQISGSKSALKSTHTLRSAKHNESGENWLESLKQKKPPTTSTNLKKAVEVIPVPTKRAASPDDNDDNINRGDIGPLNKRKKPEQSKISQTAEKARRRPLSKEALDNSKKRFKSDALLNTSEADEDSSWRPKTRLQAKLELAKNSVETKKAKIHKAQIPKADFSEESTDKFKATGQSSKKSGRRVRWRKTILSEESCEDDIEEASLKPSSAIVIETSKKEYFPPEDKSDLTHNKSPPSEPETGGNAFTSRVIFDDGAQKPDESQLNKRGVLPVDSEEVFEENQAPIAVMSLAVSSTHHIPNRSKNLPENHFQGSALRHKRKQDALLTSATPRKVINDPKISQARPGALIDDRLARKAQIISWGSSGPQNQGRTPIIEKSNAASVIREGDFSTDGEEYSEEDTSFPRPESGLGLVIIKSGDEDRVIIRKQAKSSLSIDFDKRDIETVIGMDGSPLTTPMRRANAPTELLHSNEGDDESRHSDPIDSEDSSDAVSDFEIGNIGNDDQEFPAIQDVYISEKYEPGDKERDDTLREAELTTTGEKGSHRQSLVKQKVSIIELSSDSSDSEARHQNRAPKQPSISKRSYSKPNENSNQRESPKVLNPRKAEDYFSATKENLPIPDSYVNQKSGKEWNRRVIHQSPRGFVSPSQDSQYIHPRKDHEGKPLDKRGPPATENIFEEREHTPTMARDIISGAKIAADLNASEIHVDRKIQKTGFSKWLQESGFKKVANSGHNNRKVHHISGGGSQSKDPDKTLINESSHGESETSQEREQKQQRNNHGKRTSGNESDDSDTDTSDYEDSDTEDEDDEDDGDEDEESSEDEHQKWRQSVPDYHLESLSVLNQISRGLLRYLMSGEELAMEIINDFEKNGREIAERLGASHRREYEEFLIRVKLGEKKVQMEHAKIMEAAGKDFSEITRRSETLKDVRTKLRKEYEVLDTTISTMMANLEEDLEKSAL